MGSYRSYSSAYQNDWLARPSSSPRSGAYSYSPRLDRTSGNIHSLTRRRSRSPVSHPHNAVAPSPVWSQPASWRLSHDETDAWPVYTHRVENHYQTHPENCNHRASSDRTMPKHFPRPLTCFYWRSQGRCNKSDQECWYAHYDTGVYAAAPIRTGPGEIALAGKSADSNIDAWSVRERALRDREDATQRAHQAMTEEKEIMMEKVGHLMAVADKTFQCLSSLGRTADHARVAVEKKLDGINTMMARPISDFDEAANILENAYNEIKVVFESSVSDFEVLGRHAADLEDYMSRNVTKREG